MTARIRQSGTLPDAARWLVLSWLVLSWLGVVPSLLAQDAPSGTKPAGMESRAFVELDVVSSDPGPVFVGQPVDLDLTFGIEQGFLRENLLQPFRRELDVPVTIDARWLGGGDGYSVSVVPPGEDDSAPARTAVFAGEIGHVQQRLTRTRGDGTFDCFGMRLRLVLESPGRLTLPGIELGFTFATTFEEDFFGSRVAQDPQQGTVAGKPLVLEIAAPPGEDRPAGFAGAVGRFAVEAVTTTDPLDVGSIFELTVTVRALNDRANLDTVTAPSLDALDGFHVLGRLALPPETADSRAFRYDLALVDRRATTLPAIEFTFFDPGPPASYGVARSEPLPLNVPPIDSTGDESPSPDSESRDPAETTAAERTPAETEGDATPAEAAPTAPDLEADIHTGLDLDGQDVGRWPAPPPWLVLLLLAMPLAGAAVWQARARAVERRERRAARERAEREALELRNRVRDDVHAAARSADLAATYLALTQFLSIRLNHSRAAVTDLNRLSAALDAGGVTEATRHRCCQWLHLRMTTRYGGASGAAPQPLDAASIADAIASELETPAAAASEDQA